VGDHPRDIIAGKAAGMRTIAAAYGYLPSQPAVSEWGADLIVKDVEQITYSFWPDIKIST
jgi:phosphoglycolate phosphatase